MRGSTPGSSRGVDILVVEVHRDIIEARDGVLGENRGREVPCDKMRGDRVVIRAHVPHRKSGLQFAGHRRLLQTHNALLRFAHPQEQNARLALRID